jgi:hypothetical protein
MEMTSPPSSLLEHSLEGTTLVIVFESVPHQENEKRDIFSWKNGHSTICFR